jgi:serine/threonine-protein kinase
MPPLLDHLTTSLADRYRVERELGAGGMATVYLAYDVRHDRRVALKVLRPELSAVVGADRFLAEIRTTANLQHPHILPLHDSGSVDGTVFYVMPFVDGESLRDRLNRDRQLSIEDALRIAREVADALQYAHSQGVIHRDIKPENILLQGGHALVADFGIALAASNTAGGRITETGMSLGTPTYMSPEQAMGERTLDARTDVYALGCVLYEMLVGEPPFTGATAQQIVARVMTEDPRSLTFQRKTVPPSVDAAVTAALSKLPADRPASAAAFATMLTDESLAHRTGATSRAHPSARSSRAMTLTLSVVVVAMAAVAAWGWKRGVPEPSVTRTYLRFPAEEAPILGTYAFALLPDGSGLIYAGKSATGTQLWMKRRSELHAAPVSGTAGAREAFTSPDGKWIGFFANGKLKKVPVTGGDAVTLADEECFGVACDASYQGSGTWLDDGRIVFRSRDVLVIVSENGGAVDSLVTSRMVGGFSPVFPVALPGSRGLLLSSCTLSCNKSNAWVVDLKTRKTRRIAENASYAQYSPSGHILYTDDAGTVHAIAFDAKTLTTSGTETSVIEHVAGNVVVARDGTIVYLDGDPSPHSRLAIVAKDGTEQPVDTAWNVNFATLALSPDGKRLAASFLTRAGDEQVWIRPFGTAPHLTRLTFGAAQYTTPTFSADGETIFMTRFAGDSSTFVSRRIDGTSPEITLAHGKNWVIESVTSRDGKWLITRGYRNGERSIYARRIGPTAGADTAERVIVKNTASNFSPALSPDGKWLLYSNEEAGQTETWVVPFPDPGFARWQVSTDGGSEAAWAPDGKSIYYVDQKRWLVNVEISAGSGITVGARKVLFDLAPYKRHPTHRAYEVLPDNQHFLMIHQGTRGAGEPVIMQNWFGELKKSVKRER